jgi:hypothetical protein
MESATSSNQDSLAALRLTRSFRLLRLFKLARLMKISTRMKSAFGAVAGGMRRFVSLILSLFIIMHVAACLFHFIALRPLFSEVGDESGGFTWLATVKDWPNFNATGSYSLNSSSPNFVPPINRCAFATALFAYPAT